MEERISAITLLCLVLTGIGAINVDIPLPLYKVARGGNITLPCSFTTTKPTKPVLMEWSDQADQIDAEEIPIITYYADGTIDVSSEYQGRASLDMDIPSRKFNLQLSSITLNDNKTYKCRVQIPTDQGKTIDTTHLLVLVAPSTPVCGIQGKAEYGQNISLSCVSREGSPPPTYKWENRDVGNNVRPFDPKTTIQGGLVTLYNISKDTSGFYICTSTNEIGSAMCNLTLSVMPPSMNIGSTAGIIAGVAAALFVFAIIIYCCCCRKKNKEEEYPMGVHEEESQNKMLAKSGDSPNADGQEEIRSSDNSYVKSPNDNSDHHENPSDRGNDRRRDYNDRRSDHDDRRSDYDDRRSDYKDRRSDYDDRRSDYDDRRSDYDDRRSDYSDRRDKYSDRHERYDDNRRYDDERRYENRRDKRYDDDDDRYNDDHNRDRPPAPSNKPPRRNYD